MCEDEIVDESRLVSMTPILEIEDLLVQRDGRTVLEVDHLALEKGQVLAVIGPNGAGKSTLLLTLSRLLPYERGQVRFCGQPLTDMQPLAYRRRLGLVLQDPLLLDGSVFDNVATGLRFRHIPRPEINRRVDEWLQRLGVNHLRQRPSRQLSGGEAQRVSLARAFALQPDLLLLDEPFSALDAPTRVRLLEDFQVLLADTTITTVFITHDLDEALYMGDQVAVLLSGRLRQVGEPRQVFNAPADPEVAAFVGVETIVEGRVISAHEGQVTVEANGCTLYAIGEVASSRPVYLCLRPEDITLWPADGFPPSSARNRFPARVQKVIPQGALTRVVVDCGFPMTALVTRTSALELNLAEGKDVTIAFKASAVHLIPR